jgi:hypothetical protein
MINGSEFEQRSLQDATKYLHRADPFYVYDSYPDVEAEESKAKVLRSLSTVMLVVFLSMMQNVRGMV